MGENPSDPLLVPQHRRLFKTCDEFSAVNLLLDEELENEKAISDHLKKCDDCFNGNKDYKFISNLIKSTINSTPPMELTSKILQRTTRKTIPIYRRLFAAGLQLSVGISVLVIFIIGRTHSSQNLPNKSAQLYIKHSVNSATKVQSNSIDMDLNDPEQDNSAPQMSLASSITTPINRTNFNDQPITNYLTTADYSTDAQTVAVQQKHKSILKNVKDKIETIATQNIQQPEQIENEPSSTNVEQAEVEKKEPDTVVVMVHPKLEIADNRTVETLQPLERRVSFLRVPTEHSVSNMMHYGQAQLDRQKHSEEPTEHSLKVSLLKVTLK